ncbi:hypothetical protein Sste5346_003267 [Sporothrix stenoceras]|uniref:Zn(2)-C6 fungal-type domain-containing protein n=1 Tax=Sporothrix stenoceras TaxID=5173 RepID=A0ABR3ZF86_9PEZI
MAYADQGPASSVMSRSFAHLFDDGTDAAVGAGGAGGGDQWQLPVQHQGTAVTRKVSAATAAGKVPVPLISAPSTGNLRQTLDHGEPGDRERPLAATRQREDDPYGLYPDGNSQSISARANGTDDDAERHSKRPRMALSCSECKRRKIKCDRNVPCTACIKRGRSAYCNWDEAKIDPVPQPFVLRSELQELRDRVQILESLIKAAPSGGDHAQPDVVPCHAMQAQTIQEQEGRQGRPDRQDREDQRQKNKEKECSERSSEDGKYNDNVEDAAIILESIAFNPPRDASADRPIISHEYWRGSLMAPPTSDCRPGGHCETPGAATTGTTAVKKDHIFLTAALTSIIAPTWDAVVDRYNPLLSSWDDEFKDWTRQERENHGRQQQRARLRKKREDVLNAIYAALPTVRQSYYLANQYQKTVDWRSHILYWPGFQAELKTFWELMSQGRHLDIDPLWLAVFFMVMALALDNQRADEVDVMADINHPFHGYRSQHFKDLTNRCHAISIRALHLGNPMATPRVRTIQ